MNSLTTRSLFSEILKRLVLAVRKRSCITLILSGLVAFPLACKPQRQGRNTDTNRTPITFGFIGDLSGPTFNFGESAKNGVLMAADEINQSGGINGRRIDIIFEDDQGGPEKSAILAGKLIDQDKVVALVVAGASGNSLAAGPKAQSARIPMISPSSTNPAVTQVGDYIFRACFIDAFQGGVMAKFAADTLKARKAAILLDFNSPYSRGLTDYFELGFTKLGGQVVNKQSYMQGDADYKGQLSAIKAAEPDVLYIPGYYGDVAIIARQARQLGLTQPLLGGDGWDAPELWELGGDALNGSFISNHYSVEDPSPAIQRFVHDYKLLYGNLTPDAHAALAYDAMRFLAAAIERGGTTEGPKLRDALAQTKGFAGITGTITIDSDRNAVKPSVVLKLEDGKYIYQETIQPEAVTDAAVPSSSPSPVTKKRARR